MYRTETGFVWKCWNVVDLVFYPEPAFISAVVSLALLLPLPPLYQAGGVVSRQADVTAAGCRTDSSPDASRKERLCAEWQLHPTRKWHKEWTISADSVWTLCMVWRSIMGWTHTYRDAHTPTGTQNHTCTHWCKYATTNEKKCEKNISLCFSNSNLEKNQWATAADMNAVNTSLAFCVCVCFLSAECFFNSLSGCLTLALYCIGYCIFRKM